MKQIEYNKRCYIKTLRQLQHFKIYSWTSDFHVLKKPAKPVKSDSSTKRKSDATHCSGSARVGLAPTAQHQTELMALASKETSKHKSSFTDHVMYF